MCALPGMSECVCVCAHAHVCARGGGWPSRGETSPCLSSMEAHGCPGAGLLSPVEGASGVAETPVPGPYRELPLRSESGRRTMVTVAPLTMVPPARLCHLTPNSPQGWVSLVHVRGVRLRMVGD